MGEPAAPREDHQPPAATGEWGWRYHHVGIPTQEVMPGERYIPQFGMYVSGFCRSPFGIEWMRFEPGSPVHPLVQSVAHIAFEVDDLDAALRREGFRILTPPNAPSDGVRVAMVEHNGAPIELIAFGKAEG